MNNITSLKIHELTFTVNTKLLMGLFSKGFQKTVNFELSLKNKTKNLPKFDHSKLNLKETLKKNFNKRKNGWAKL